MRYVKSFLLPALVVLNIIACEGQTAQQQSHVQTVHITILSTNLAEEGDGEWGFAALVEADEHRILFDTGAHCTGVEPVYRIRAKAGLNRQTCIVGGVGDQFLLNKGVIAGLLTH
jgi:hypothetical protein